MITIHRYCTSAVSGGMWRASAFPPSRSSIFGACQGLLPGMGRLLTVVKAGPVFKIHKVGTFLWHEPVPHSAFSVFTGTFFQLPPDTCLGHSFVRMCYLKSWRLCCESEERVRRVSETPTQRPDLIDPLNEPTIDSPLSRSPMWNNCLYYLNLNSGFVIY